MQISSRYSIFFILGVFALLCFHAQSLSIFHNAIPDDICSVAEYDYAVKKINNGYEITFVSSAENVFTAYVNLVWSGIIARGQNPDQDAEQQPAPTKEQTIRLKRAGPNIFRGVVTTQSILKEVLPARTISDLAAASMIHADNLDENETIMSALADYPIPEVNVRFFFHFWAVDVESGNESDLCNSPFYVI